MQMYQSAYNAVNVTKALTICPLLKVKDVRTKRLDLKPMTVFIHLYAICFKRP